MTYLCSLKVVEGQNFVIPCYNGAKLDGFGYTVLCWHYSHLQQGEKKLSHYRLKLVSSTLLPFIF
jgi:hypothetical protein